MFHRHYRAFSQQPEDIATFKKIPYSALRSLFLFGEEIPQTVRLETEPSGT